MYNMENITQTQHFAPPQTNSNANFIDSTSTVETAVSSVATREIQRPDPVNDLLFTETLIPSQFSIDAKPFIERPYYLTTVDWNDTFTRGDILPHDYQQLPGDNLRSNPSLLSATKLASLYRSDLELVVSVAGTITHAGCILVGVIPPLYGKIDTTVNHIELINTIMSGPHARLFANEATSVVIKVPWYCNTEMATLDMEMKSDNYIPSADIVPTNGNYGTLVFLVLNKLQPSSGSSKSLKITVESVFRSLDMRVPTPRYVKWVTQSSYFATLGTSLADSVASKAKVISADFIDKARSILKKETGLHNPNSSLISQRVITTDRNFLNTTDTETFYETLDTKNGVNRFVDCPVFNTSQDEMMLDHIISKKQYLGTFRVNQNDPTGTLLWARPISPNQFNTDSSSSTRNFTNNIQFLHYLTRAWRGDLKVTIEAVMNNKQQVKLRLLQMYNPSISCVSSFPEYRTILNAPSHLMEFSEGGQCHEVVLPYLCRNELTPCSIENYAEALFHGMYYVYVAQPLANSGDSPMDVYFNIYMEGTPSLQFFGYSTNAYTTTIPIIIKPGSFSTQAMRVMNEPQKQNDTNESESATTYINRLQRVVSVRDLIRRVCNVHKFSIALSPGYNFYTLPISPLYNETENYLTNLWDSPLRGLSAMYYGKFPSTKFQVRVVSYKQNRISSENVLSSVYYAPQAQYVYSPGGIIMGTYTDPNLAILTLGDQNSDFPLTYQNVPAAWNPAQLVHEFSVPNTSLFKFVGGPKKMTRTVANPKFQLAIQDCGTLIFSFFNQFDETIPVEVLLNAGANDECRLGFHTIAPRVEVPKVDGGNKLTFGYGNIDDLGGLPSGTAVSYINFTRS